jgi:pSer/pThr/pTyr-binding forkhead associated (FHA) protein
VSGDKFGFDSDSTIVGEPSALSAPGAARKPARLELVSGPGAPREFAIVSEETVIGRSTQATICIESLLLSRRHAAVRRLGPELRLVDLESANGVYLNGVKVHSAGLFDGDSIQIGDVLLLFHEGR